MSERSTDVVAAVSLLERGTQLCDAGREVAAVFPGYDYRAQSETLFQV